MSILNMKTENNPISNPAPEVIDRRAVLKKPGIYMIECLRNGKIYIGRSKNMRRRVYAHSNALSNGSHNDNHLQNAYNKYGPGSLVARTVEVLPKDDWMLHQERESYWVNYYDTFNTGFNIAPIVIGDRPPEYMEKVSGENNHRAKLSESDVIRICELLNEGQMKRTDIAEMFNVAPTTISKIKNGMAWTNVTDGHLDDSSDNFGNTKLSESDVIRICELLNEGQMNNTDIAVMFNVTPTTISDIKYGKTWTNVTDGHLDDSSDHCGSTKLSESDVIRIRELLNEGQMNNTDIAVRFAVNRRTIYDIKHGKTWTHISEKHLDGSGDYTAMSTVYPKLTKSDVIRIRELLNVGQMNLRDIAEMFKVKPPVILQIKNGKSRTYISEKHLGDSAKSLRKPGVSKISESDVICICEMLNEGVVTREGIAELFAISRKTVYDIKYSKTWTHITDQYLTRSV